MIRVKVAFSRIPLTEKIPPQSPRWNEFNGSFDNLTLKPTEIAEQIKGGFSFTTWHKDAWRTTDNFICGQHLAVDMDTGDERSTIDALLRHPVARLYAGLYYTTPSHTDESPRARVLFFLDKPLTDPVQYQAAARFVCELFPGSDTAPSSPASFFYGSKGCVLALFENRILPLGQLRLLYKQHRDRNGSQPKKTAQSSGEYNGPVDRDQVLDALQYIDPYMGDYNWWFGILACLAEEFGTTVLAEAEAWAKPKLEREVEIIFGQVANKVQPARRMTVGTIFHLAKQRGWNNGNGTERRADGPVDSDTHSKTPDERLEDAGKQPGGHPQHTVWQSLPYS